MVRVFGKHHALTGRDGRREAEFRRKREVARTRRPRVAIRIAEMKRAGSGLDLDAIRPPHQLLAGAFRIQLGQRMVSRRVRADRGKRIAGQLAKLDTERARGELVRGADRIEAETGTRPVHLSYPYGDAGSAGPRDFALAAELGFATAVTTRKGMVFPDHADHLTALPRVSLNGAYQSLLYTRLYLSGAPFALWSGFRRVDAA